MEILVDGEGHLVADAQHGTEGVRAHAHVRDRAQVFEGSVLLLEREAHGVAFTVNLDLPGLYLDGLAAAHRLHEGSGDCNAGAGGYLREQVLGECGLVHDYLDIIDGRTVIECDERHVLVAPLGPYPAFGKDILSRLAREQVFDLGPDNCFHNAMCFCFNLQR